MSRRIRRTSAATRYWLLCAAAWAIASMLILVAGQALAAGGPPSRKLVNIADTRGLPPWLTRWIGDLYNTSDWLFATLVVAVMVTMGVVLGLGCDRAMGMLGINLGKIKHHE